MLVYDEKKHLLSQQCMEYPLHEVAEPELFRDIFPYSEVPKSVFGNQYIPTDVPEHIWITDTTFRDGQQSRAPYSAKQMVDLFTLLHRLGGEKGLIRMSEFFVYSKKDRDAIAQCMDLGYQFPEITTWIRAVKSDYQLLKEIGVKETGILVSCSDYHIFKKLHMTRSQALQHYLGVIGEAFAEGVVPRCHFEDITRADFDGFVLPFACELMRLSEQYGLPVKLRACDTMGYALPYPGTQLPRSVPAILAKLRHCAGFPSEWLEWHGHNDFYKGVANATAAWLYGASAVNCSLLGIGERCGNVPLEAMVFEYASLRGSLDGMDTTVITEIAEYYEKELHYRIPPMTPYVGKSFNITRAGIHADGLMKDEEIYNIFDTKALLNRPASVAISNSSGLAGIAFWLTEYLGRTVAKRDPLTLALKEWIDGEYDEGRISMISEEELIQKLQELNV